MAQQKLKATTKLPQSNTQKKRMDESTFKKDLECSKHEQDTKYWSLQSKGGGGRDADNKQTAKEGAATGCGPSVYYNSRLVK